MRENKEDPLRKRNEKERTAASKSVVPTGASFINGCALSRHTRGWRRRIFARHVSPRLRESSAGRKRDALLRHTNNRNLARKFLLIQHSFFSFPLSLSFFLSVHHSPNVLIVPFHNSKLIQRRIRVVISTRVQSFSQQRCTIFNIIVRYSVSIDWTLEIISQRRWMGNKFLLQLVLFNFFIFANRDCKV